MKNNPVVSIYLSLLALTIFTACAGRRADYPEAPPDRITGAVVSEGQLMAGAAVADITPDGNVFMAGFGQFRRSRDVHDPLGVRALVLRNGDMKIALVTMDLIGIMKPELDAYRAMIDGFDENDLIIVGASHTHSGPDVMGYWGGVKDEYMVKIGAAMKSAVEEADSKAVPARLLAGTGTIPDGAIKNVRQTDLLDLRVEALQVVSEADGTAIATLVDYACHPETMWSDNHTITADFVYVIRREIEAGGGGTALFFNGALGAMVTPDVWRGKKYKEVHTFEEVERIGEIMMRGVRKAIEAAEPVDVGTIKWVRHEFFTPVNNPIFEKAAGLGLFDRQIFSPGGVYTEVAAVKIGDVTIITIPGEARPDIGLEIKAATGAKHPILIGLGNDELGYILPEDAFNDNLVYVYEPTMSTGMESNRRIVENALALAGRLEQ